MLCGGFKYFSFSPLFGEDEPILTNIFQMGWNHQLEWFFELGFKEMGVRGGFPRFVGINSKKPWNSSYDPSSQVPKRRSRKCQKKVEFTWIMTIANVV